MGGGGRSKRALVVLAAVAAAGWGLPAAPAGAQQPPSGGDRASGRLALEARAELTGFSPPDEVTVRLTRPAHVAVFEIRPGLGTLLRYPRSRRQGNVLRAGVHRILLRTGPGELDDGFRRLPGYPDLPALGRLSPLHLGFLGRPFLLVVASRDPLWLSGRYLGRVVQPGQVFPSLGLLVDDVLRDVVPNPRSGAWAFDLVPARPLLHPLPYGGYVEPPGPLRGPLLPPPRRRVEPPRTPGDEGGHGEDGDRGEGRDRRGPPTGAPPR